MSKTAILLSREISSQKFYDDLVANTVMNYLGISKLEYYHLKRVIDAKREFNQLKKQALDNLKLMQ